MSNDVDHERQRRAVRKHLVARFTRYSAMSLITVPTGYALLLAAHHRLPINAGLLNVLVGTLLTPPSYLLYRSLVWRDRKGRGVLAEMFAFWKTVMAGTAAASVAIAVADAGFDRGDTALVLIGLTTQVVVFLLRFVWLDKVTFAKRQ